MKTCVICGKILEGKNKSKEHIIHNALGGVLEDDAIYCKECNEMYGSNQDRTFIQIFAPVVDNINMHKTRKTNGTSYTGKMRDKDGNLYYATYKNGKVVKLENSDSKYVKYEEDKFETISYNFKLDNEVYKQGISKIAFNYAIYCGLKAYSLENVFDYSTKKLVSKPVIIPFLPLTFFDWVMEMHSVEKISHVIRIFNYENLLYAYVELFNTFQNYVLLSENYDVAKLGDIDESYANIVERKRSLEKNIWDSIHIRDYKDADIMINQYRIKINKVIEDLKTYHQYDKYDKFEQEKMLFARIEKIAYEKKRKQSYIKDYEVLLDHHVRSIDWSKEILLSQDINKEREKIQSFMFYTIYGDDGINMKKYKKIYPQSLAYPSAICDYLNGNLKIKDYGQIKDYGHVKFNKLMERLNR